MIRSMTAGLVAALNQIAASPLCDPMTAATIRTLLSGDVGEEFRDVVHALAVEYEAKGRAQRSNKDPWWPTSSAAKLRTSAICSAHYAMLDALSGRHGYAERLAVASAKRIARAAHSGVTGAAQ